MAKLKIAVQLVKRQLKTMTPEQRSARARKAVAARWAKTTPAQRKAHSRKMVKARLESGNKYGKES